MPSGRKKGFVEEKVLEKATQRFAAFGFAGTTLADLEAAMGIGRQSIYETFGDKRSLYRTCLDRYRQREIEPLLHALREAPSAEAKGLIVLKTARRCAVASPCRGGMVLGTLMELPHGDPELAHQADMILGAIHEELLSGLAKAAGNPQTAEGPSPADLTAFLVASFLGILTLARGGRLTQWVDAAADQAEAGFRLLLRG